MTLPVALAGNDVIGQAKTGTGKTLGFGLPILERVTVAADVEAGRATAEQLTDSPQALVVVPTRELCQQVTNDLLTAGKVRAVRVLAIYGGRAYEPQVEALKKGVDVIVGTPGRLLDLAGQKKLNLKQVRALVLDEADEMLDLGFLPDVEKIMGMLPAKRQTMLFSATMPGAVISLARRYMSQPTHIRATAPDDEGATVANITQHVFRAHSMDKPELISRVLQADGRGLAMIFCRTKRTAADVAEQLERRGFASGAVHGDLGQGAREQALRAFRNGKVDVLVCTDVAARGIDVEGVTHVINYQTPEDEKTYLHRIGRTGRAGASGTAITLVDWDDIPRWQLINKALDLPFNAPEETYSTSPHLYELLGIPAGTKGVLPRAERTRAGLDAEEVEDLGETGGRGRRDRQGDRQGTRQGGRQGERNGDRGDRQEQQERPERTRTPRQRRRTRGGSDLAQGESRQTTPVQGGNAPVGNAPAGTEQSGADQEQRRTPRRRRRTRGTAVSGAAAPVAAEAVTEAAAQVVADAAEVVEEAAVQAVENLVAEPVKAPRRRTRKAAASSETAPVVAEAAEVAEAVADTVTEAAEPAKAPRRRAPRKTATSTKAVETAAEVVADTVEASAEAAEPAKAPRRRARARPPRAPRPRPRPWPTPWPTPWRSPPRPPNRRRRRAAAPPARPRRAPRPSRPRSRRRRPPPRWWRRCPSRPPSPSRPRVAVPPARPRRARRRRRPSPRRRRCRSRPPSPSRPRAAAPRARPRRLPRPPCRSRPPSRSRLPAAAPARPPRRRRPPTPDRARERGAVRLHPPRRRSARTRAARRRGASASRGGVPSPVARWRSGRHTVRRTSVR
nr:DEAD/DEAH box helicase [Actinacidiphila yeochonensis]